jgi:putative peptide maturation system protein
MTAVHTPLEPSVAAAELLADVLGTLEALAADGPSPRNLADAALAGLRERWPGHTLRLVRDHDPADGSVSHDVLIRGEAGTASVAYSPHPATPWPLRGAMRHADSVLLRVNETQLRVEEALTALDTLWNSATVLTRLIDTAIVWAELEREPAVLDELQLQHAADAFRRAKGLLTAEATHQWLRDAGLGPAAFEALVRQVASMHALRHRVAAGRVDDWIAEHADEFATVTVAWVEKPHRLGTGDEAEARAAVAEHVHNGRYAGVTRLRFDRVPDDLRPAAVGAEVTAELCGTAASTLVLRRDPDRSAETLQAARARAEQALFDAWLANARRSATVQWCWLDVERTSAVG